MKGPSRAVSLLSRIFGKGNDKRDALRPLWHRVVEIAREKPWYAECGVADTVPGRFDAVTMVLAVVMLRMEREEKDKERTAKIEAKKVQQKSEQQKLNTISPIT